MRPPRNALGFAFACALALALGVGGCVKPNTVLLVEVEGPADVHPNQLRVTVTVGLIETHVIMVPAVPLVDGHQIEFPTSFTVSIDQSRTAPITISIDALDKSSEGIQASIGYAGNTTSQHVEIGGQTTITVVLTEVPTDQPDGGVDGAVDASDTGGSGGTAGTGGSGGAGAGGAAGQDGAADEAGDAGLSLDGAAD